MKLLIEDVALSVMRALCDRVTDNLQKVMLRVSEGLIEGTFVYQTEPSELEIELTSEAETEVISDYHAYAEVRFVPVAMSNASGELNEGEILVFRRM